MKLPELPLENWEKTKTTLHLYLQIIGKIRLGLTPRKNHWWYITLYVSARGITTGSIPYQNRIFEIELNFLKYQVDVFCSDGQYAHFSLQNGLTVADFYQNLLKVLNQMNIEVKIVDRPYDLGIDLKFGEIQEFNQLDPEYIRRFWNILVWVDNVFKEFSGRFYGKTCPVHLYWHHMDLAVTRFSGKKAPPMPAETKVSDKDAYSHEVISFGFWAGDEKVREPAFYAYTYPSPAGLDLEPLQPASARWVDNNSSPMAYLGYHDLLKEKDPAPVLLAFLESAYQAGAKLAGWDIAGFQVPELSSL
jgi:hypothetical protein